MKSVPPPNKKQAAKRVVKKPLVSTLGLDTRKLADIVPQTQPESFSDLALDRRVPVSNMVAVDQRRGIINVMVQSRIDEIDDKLRNYMRTAKLGVASGDDGTNTTLISYFIPVFSLIACLLLFEMVWSTCCQSYTMHRGLAHWTTLILPSRLVLWSLQWVLHYTDNEFFNY